jgi:hypothetical protein
VADVTSLVTGNGNYSLSGFMKTDPNGVIADANGVSLLVFFDDGNEANDVDVYIARGADSNVDFSGSTDPPGWQATLSGVEYPGGSAALQMHVSEGQVVQGDRRWTTAL